VIVLALLAALLLVGVFALIPLGLRAGDRPGDVLLLDVEPRGVPRGARVTMTNPGQSPVIFGVSLRRAGPRVRLEAGSYVRHGAGSTARELLADAKAQLGVLEAGRTGTVVVPAAARVGRRAELVAVIGQPGRLRTIHRVVVLPRASC
jgi:hypothetical protein